jgi:hypothetical protein
VQLTEELLPAAMEDMAEHPELLVMPVPETERATEFAVVPPLFCMFRLTVYVESLATLTLAGLTESEMEGGRTTLNELDSAVVGLPAMLMIAFIFTPLWAWEMTAVVQLTLVVPELNDFNVPSPDEKPAGVSVSVTVPLSLRSETVMMNELPCMIVPESAPDWETVTVAA